MQLTESNRRESLDVWTDDYRKNRLRLCHIALRQRPVGDDLSHTRFADKNNKSPQQRKHNQSFRSELRCTPHNQLMMMNQEPNCSYQWAACDLFQADKDPESLAVETVTHREDRFMYLRSPKYWMIRASDFSESQCDWHIRAVFPIRARIPKLKKPAAACRWGWCDEHSQRRYIMPISVFMPTTSQIRQLEVPNESFQ